MTSLLLGFVLGGFLVLGSWWSVTRPIPSQASDEDAHAPAGEDSQPLSLSDRVRRVFTRLVGAVSSTDEEPCVRSLTCEHEETKPGAVVVCDDPTCEAVTHTERVCTECTAHVGWRDDVSVSDVIQQDASFRGPGGLIWRVAVPWLPVEIHGQFALCVKLVAVEGGEYLIERERFTDQIAAGDFVVIDAPEDIATDGGERSADSERSAGSECDDFVTVHNRLQTAFNSALVLIHDDRAEQFEVYDKHPDAVDADLLAYIQAQGFEILEIGRKACEVTDQEQAYVAFRRHDPAEVSENGGDER